MHDKFMSSQIEKAFNFIEKYAIKKAKENKNLSARECVEEATEAYVFQKSNGGFDKFNDPVSDFTKRICNY